MTTSRATPSLIWMDERTAMKRFGLARIGNRIGADVRTCPDMSGQFCVDYETNPMEHPGRSPAVRLVPAFDFSAYSPTMPEKKFSHPNSDAAFLKRSEERRVGKE